jgi:hypothetical protein
MPCVDLLGLERHAELVVQVTALSPGDVAHLRLARFTCLFDFRDGYGSLDHLNTDSFSDGFDYWSDRLFDPPRSFLLCRAGFGLGLGNRSLGRSLGRLACLTA